MIRVATRMTRSTSQALVFFFSSVFLPFYLFRLLLTCMYDTCAYLTYVTLDVNL